MRLPPETQDVSLSTADTLRRVNYFDRRCKGELPYLRLTSRHPLEAHLFYVVCQQRAEAKLGLFSILDRVLVGYARKRISPAATSVQSTFVSSFPARGARAPTKLSVTLPKKAASATSSAAPDSVTSPSISPRRAVSPAAARPANVPGTETAPSVPGETFRRVVMRRGTLPTSCPTSDSAVSAKAAPRAATKAAANACEGKKAARTAHKSATPQLARAFLAPRRPPWPWATPRRCLLW